MFPLMSNMLEQLTNIVFALELFNTSAAVDELLLSCKEWVASRANVKPHFRLCRLGYKLVSACASNFTFHIIRMDSFLHASTSFLICSGRTLAFLKLLCFCTAYVLYHSARPRATPYIWRFYRANLSMDCAQNLV